MNELRHRIDGDFSSEFVPSSLTFESDVIALQLSLDRHHPDNSYQGGEQIVTPSDPTPYDASQDTVESRTQMKPTATPARYRATTAAKEDGDGLLIAVSRRESQVDLFAGFRRAKRFPVT
jgi:hypothetical protein